MKLSIAIGVILIAGACGDNIKIGPTELEALVDSYEEGGISRQDYLVALSDFEDDGSIGQTLSGRLGHTVLLHARAEPYLVAPDFEVARGAILVIEQGARLQIATDAEIEISGRIYAVAPPNNPIYISAKAGEYYTDLFLRSGPNQLVSVDFSRAARTVHVTHPGSTHTLIENGRFNSWRDLAIAQNNSSGLHVLNSSFGYETPTEEVSGESIRTRNSGRIVIEGSSFSYRTGYRDVLDLQDCLKEPEEWPVVIGNLFDGGEDDGVDLDNCSAIVIGNHIRNFRPIDLTRQDAGVNGGGVTGDGEGSTPFIANNIIEGCFHAVGFKNGAQPAIVNNTIINSNIGITLYQSKEGNPMPAGLAYNNVLAGNVGWLDGANNDVVLNGKWWRGYNQVDEVQATIDARYNIFATLPMVYPGEGNSNDDPQLDSTSNLPHLLPGSAAIDSGLGEFDLPNFEIQQALDYLQVDFENHPRIRDGSKLVLPDRGALEVQ